MRPPLQVSSGIDLSSCTLTVATDALALLVKLGDANAASAFKQRAHAAFKHCTAFSS